MTRKAIDSSMAEWLESGEYLPAPLRDFHDQKDVFKAIHQTINVEGHAYAKGVDWISGQCYVIDIFLWWMARHGYTLQRSRKKLPFRSLADDVSAATEERDNAFFAAFKNEQQSREPA